MRGHLEGDEHFLQSQGAARGGAYFGDPTDEFRFNMGNLIIVINLFFDHT